VKRQVLRPCESPNKLTNQEYTNPSDHMNEIAKPERETQNRVVELFQKKLDYRYLGNWKERENSNIEEGVLLGWLITSGYSMDEASRAVEILKREASNASRSLMENNQKVYELLRYGIPVQTDAGSRNKTVHLIDWRNPAKNDFSIAEEVTLKGNHDRRPDIVLYINGIAIGVLELKNSRVSLEEGVRQNLSNQLPEFNAWFFSTVQMVFAGNDSEGLKYGTVGTPAKYFLHWKEDEADDVGYKLDKYLVKMCNKERLLELIRDFIVFDAGIKKLPRPHQYFAVKAAQERILRGEGGIIWHTQGSGKSIVMVMLALWILENIPDARLAAVTDRGELCDQLHGVFSKIGVKSAKATSGRNLRELLSDVGVRVVNTLIHKFGKVDYDELEKMAQASRDGKSPFPGRLFVFVDECHRTNSGKLHQAMKAALPGSIFIGFSGTPLLKADAPTSREVFGEYIHTYKYREGVTDKIVLDLIYEARDIDQRITSPERIDEWFESATRDADEAEKEQLKKKWGTMQQLLSSRDRMERIVGDIVHDFARVPRLNTRRGNAILVASSIYEACKYYECLQKSPLRSQCAVVTSYNPNVRDTALEELGANDETDRKYIYNVYTQILKDASTTAEGYVSRSKKDFVENPGRLKLLVVVDMLLTGFDAPACSYLYLDKVMRDHGLFQAICRTNRLDGEDKMFGYIVDYRGQFQRLTDAVGVYSADLEEGDSVDSGIRILDRIASGKKRLDDALESVRLLCDPVPPPKGEEEYIRHFCGNTEIPSDRESRKHVREAFYKATATLFRSYSSIADKMLEAGYTEEDKKSIATEISRHLATRDTIARAGVDIYDLKRHEPDMRHLIDTYIETSPSRVISPFIDTPFLEVMEKLGDIQRTADLLGEELGGNRTAVAETIENNVRSKIHRENLNDPAFYGKMSDLLDELIKARKEKAIAYEEYLKKIEELARTVTTGHDHNIPEVLRSSSGLRAIYNNLKSTGKEPSSPSSSETTDPMLDLAQRLHEAIKDNALADWRGSLVKERGVKKAMHSILQDDAEVDRLFAIVKNQGEY
jgi:type I restriction enzyme R subunit